MKIKKFICTMVAILLIFSCIFALSGKKDYGRYSLDKSLIQQISENNPNYVSIEDMPDNLINAVIVAEDKRFYRHYGFDVIGIGRALVTNIKSGSFKEGGSTITQQLAKNLFLSTDKKISRKLEELLLAIRLENMYDKDEILEMYLNVVYFGSGAYGVGNASLVYFDKDVSKLSLEECAMLAGLLKAPSAYNPNASAEMAEKRQKTILKLMQQQGFIKPTVAVLCSGEVPCFRYPALI